MSQKAFSSFLLPSDLNVLLDPAKTNLDNSSVVRKLPVRTRRSASRRANVTWSAFESKKNELSVYVLKNTFTEEVIRPEVYALATVGRDEVAHEIKGSTREELRDSLRLALQQMPG